MSSPANDETPEQLSETVFLIDDDESFRKSITRLLRIAGFTVRDFASAGAFLVEIPHKEAGCILLDIRMPGPDGMELFHHLQRLELGTPVIFLTGHGDVPTAVKAIHEGAFDFLTKPVEKEVLLETIQKALRQGAEERKANERRHLLRDRFSELTPTEKKVYELVVQGLPNKAIANQVGCAERTTKLHRANLSRKLGANCVADLIRFRFEADLHAED